MSRLVLGVAFLLLLLAAPARAALVQLPLDRLVTRSSPDGGLAFAMPELWGMNADSVRLELVFQPLGDDPLEPELLVDGKVVARERLSPQRFAWSHRFRDLPAGGSTVRVLLSRERLCTAGGPAGALDAAASRLVVETGEEGVLLPAVDQLLGPFGGNELVVWTPLGVAGDWQLSWAARLAQGWALRDLHRAPRVRTARLPIGRGSFELLPGVDTDAMPGGLNVVIGTLDELEGLVSERVLGQIGAAYVGLLTDPAQPFKAWLVISGRDEREVATAAAAVARPGFAWPNGSAVLLDPADPDLAAVAPYRVLTGPRQADAAPAGRSFASLGWTTGTWRLDQDRIVEVDLLVNGDPAALPGAASIRLNGDYAPGFAAGSALHLRANGLFVGSVALDPQGGSLREEALEVPLHRLRQGSNRLELIPEVAVDPQILCGAGMGGIEPTLTLYEDSSIDVPWLGSPGGASDIASWMMGADLAGSELRQGATWVLGDQRPQTVDAALTLLAARAQIASRFLSEARITFDRGFSGTDVVLVGSWAGIDKILSGRPIIDEPSGMFAADQARLADARGLFKFGLGSAAVEPLRQIVQLLVARNAPQEGSAMFAFQRGSQRVVAVAGRDGTELVQAVQSLVERRRDVMLEGDVVTIGQGGRQMVAHRAIIEQGPEQPEGQLQTIAFELVRMAQETPLRWLAVMFGAVVLLAFLTLAATRSRRVRDAETA
ncbi:cellulose biosynthesis cyclic di-GMP-binding regulatory protein BcsB [Marinimicrococcus flavescens]|uniref:Cyclic di-GMP-binding protein n=1 Tax=Marinimicrococcus flavescens TaxID=3031815 RepID=A0AAP3UYB6_9PROT|nr:cellulose biosynthesis cyclic di-GMP-binding regulatory protein BcsB [Marinimicrococcus flavescens]